MRAVTELFTIDGQGILVPDSDVTVTTADIEGEALRDRSGVLHRYPLRRGVTVWEFSYDQLSDEERQTMLELLHRQPVFPFTYPGKSSPTLCFCKETSARYHDAVQGIWKDFCFRIQEV